jgi:2-polyprenyl-6-hydroxyphenyl methylase/3-demethylubiquinone-9 3-methyltransferase
MQYKYVEYKWERPETCAHNYIVPVIMKIIREIRLPSHVKILDAGCGGGSLVHTLHNHLGFKNVYGFDASESGISLGKNSFPELAENFFIHNACEVKLPSTAPQSYDLVISMEVVEHLYDPKTYLRNIYIWLKKGGFLILTIPYHGYIKNLSIAILNKFDRHFDPLSEGGHIKFFSKKMLYSLLKDSGFKPMKFYGSGRLPYLWKSMVIAAQKI